MFSVQITEACKTRTSNNLASRGRNERKKRIFTSNPISILQPQRTIVVQFFYFPTVYLFVAFENARRICLISFRGGFEPRLCLLIGHTLLETGRNASSRILKMRYPSKWPRKSSRSSLPRQPVASSARRLVGSSACQLRLPSSRKLSPHGSPLKMADCPRLARIATGAASAIAELFSNIPTRCREFSRSKPLSPASRLPLPTSTPTPTVRLTTPSLRRAAPKRRRGGTSFLRVREVFRIQPDIRPAPPARALLLLRHEIKEFCAGQPFSRKDVYLASSGYIVGRKT